MPIAVLPVESSSVTSHWNATYQRPQASYVKHPALTFPPRSRDFQKWNLRLR